MGKNMIHKFATTAAVLSLACASNATTLLEYNFTTGPTGNDQPASVSVASNMATFIDSNNDTTGVYPTVNTGPTGIAASDPGVLNGYINFTGGFGSKESMVTKNTAGVGNNNYWVNYFGSGVGYGTGTAIVVYKPTVAGHGRDAFISHRAGGTGGFWLIDNVGGGFEGPRLLMQGADVGFSSIGGNWNTSHWYLIVASWTTGGAVQLFMEDMTTPGTTYYTSGGTVATTSNADMSAPIYFNVRDNALAGGSSAPSGESQDGLHALYRFTDQYTDSTTKFDAIFNSLIPEPASLSLLGFGGVLMLRRRR